MAKYEPDEVEYSCSGQRDVLIENLPKSFMALVDKLTEQDKKIKELTKRQEHVIVDNTPLTDLKKSELIKEVDYLKSMVSTLERRVTLLEEKQQAGPGAVAFFATLSDDIGHLHDRQRLVFDNVITNTGDAYNEHNGSFVAPVAGLYVFSTTLMSNKGGYGDFRLIRNGNVICVIYPDAGGTSGSYDMATCSSVLHLKKNDDVAIESGINKFKRGGVNGKHYSNFSGFLLKAD